jgi:4-amino-4-deoxy-L-arabinose transferase-like glycosyltransferase
MEETSPDKKAALGPAHGDGRAVAALDRLARGWRAPLLAAIFALLAGLPGLLTVPTLDRDEARFAQATAQMLETGDVVNIRYQDAPRDKKPVGIHWLQATVVDLFSSVEQRDIRAYRIPSLLGAAGAAAACAWGAAAFLTAGGAFAAGLVLGGGFILSSEAFIAKTDAVLCFAVTLMMAALGRLYMEARGGIYAGRLAKPLFWFGLALALLVKGPIGPMVAILAVLSLWAADRQIRWTRDLSWVWGLILVAALVGPWAMAITVATDGGFWTSAVGGDLAPKLSGGHESHGAPPGLHLLLLPILSFPFAFLLPAAAVAAWKGRGDPGVRFALAWLIPSWIVFEALPTKLPHYTLPLYGALAWLAAYGMTRAGGRWTQWIGAAFALLGGAVLVALALAAPMAYAGSMLWGVLAALLAALAVAAALLSLWRKAPLTGLLTAGVLGIGAHGALAGGVAPSLEPLWVSKRAAALLKAAGLDPQDGATLGPVATAGYAEPSLVFALGTETELTNGEGAAEALAEGRPALVESREDEVFRKAIASLQVDAAPVGRVSGLNYSNGRRTTLTLWRNLEPPPPPPPPAEEKPLAGPNGPAAEANSVTRDEAAAPARRAARPRRAR